MASHTYNIMSISTPYGLLLQISGKITADNAAQMEDDIAQIRADVADAPIVIDADDLAYISSAGLRVIMRLNKSVSALTIRNAHSDVYDVFEMTGLTKLMDIRRIPREIGVDGLVVVDSDELGTTYRLDDDKVVKMYKPTFTIDDIELERRRAHEALVAGTPTALPFETVRCGNQLGIVFERIDE